MRREAVPRAEGHAVAEDVARIGRAPHRDVVAAGRRDHPCASDAARPGSTVSRPVRGPWVLTCQCLDVPRASACQCLGVNAAQRVAVILQRRLPDLLEDTDHLCLHRLFVGLHDLQGRIDADRRLHRE
ncbi:hypothetical protein VQ03_15930 [Methylobacterium tarhaniae]|uniref:Uncharacterized protein n=1 Tax=Methylobacterium tarhaniae TaxID=1187852 RepID=A0A0J6T010_9HYPH|nr:hypothetical protein [Methylobacterium tarhaniae]KMO39197.1 hypothetical protein VQ03_15930 [Methylobacterium tarhaniae]